MEEEEEEIKEVRFLFSFIFHASRLTFVVFFFFCVFALLLFVFVVGLFIILKRIKRRMGIMRTRRGMRRKEMRFLRFHHYHGSILNMHIEIILKL